MGGPKKGGRPKPSTWGMTQLYMRMFGYMKITWPKTKHGKVKSELTSWNAFQKLVESKYWKGIVLQLSKKYSNKLVRRSLEREREKFIRQMLGKEKRFRNNFYKNVVRRKGKDALIKYFFTKKEDYTLRTKR